MMRRHLWPIALPLACLALAGCSTTGTTTATRPTAAETATADASDPGKVDDVTRGILMAAGLDPADPAKPRELRKQIAAVVQVRYHGQNYGTALARPAPGKISFVDPAAVANLLAGADAKPQLADALKAPLVDVDSHDCHAASHKSRKTRKGRRKLNPPAVCPAPSGSIWADFNRRQMAVEIHAEPRLAALIQDTPTKPGLAAPTLLASQQTAPTTAAAVPVPSTAHSDEPRVNLLSPEAIAAVSQQPDPSVQAAVPVAVATPALPQLPKPAIQAAAPSSPEPVSLATLLAPKPAAATPPVVLIAPPEEPADAPSTAESSAFAPTPRTIVSETDDSYMPSAHGGVRVVQDSYRPTPATGTTKFFHTKY